MASPTAAEEEATWRHRFGGGVGGGDALEGDVAGVARRPGRSRAANCGAGRRPARRLLDGFAGGLDAADLALGAVGDLGHGGGDLATRRGRSPRRWRPSAGRRRRRCRRLLGQLGHRARPAGRASRCRPRTDCDGVVADQRRRPRRRRRSHRWTCRASGGVTGDDVDRSGHRRRRASSALRRSVVQWSRSVCRRLRICADGLLDAAGEPEGHREADRRARRRAARSPRVRADAAAASVARVARSPRARPWSRRAR